MRVNDVDITRNRIFGIGGIMKTKNAQNIFYSFEFDCGAKERMRERELVERSIPLNIYICLLPVRCSRKLHIILDQIRYCCYSHSLVLIVKVLRLSSQTLTMRRKKNIN